MATITLQGSSINTCGNLPSKGETAKNFTLVRSDLSEISLPEYKNKRKILSIFPSLDTPVCATSVRTFNQKASELTNVIILNISYDLPFAHARFCASEGIKNVETLSCFNSSFAKDYNLKIIDGPLKGLCSRAIIVLDENNRVLYTEQVPEIAQEPNYNLAINALH